MAYERSATGKVKGDSLDSFVQNLSTAYSNQIAIRNGEDEARFSEAVLAENLSLEDQLAYRKEQAKRVADDPAERKRIRLEIANLKDRIEQQDFTDEYGTKLQGFQSGIASIDSVIQFLNDQLDNTDDVTLQNTINSKLAEAQAQKFSITQSLIKNQTEYATNSKSTQVIDTQITRVNSLRSAALLSGNDQLVSVYDLQLQALSQAKTMNQVQNDVLLLAALSSTGSLGAIGLLDSINAKIANAASTGPVKVGDTTYASAKDFWTFKRDQYLSDSSSNGFFSSLNTEAKNKMSVANSKNLLTSDGVKAAVSSFDTLTARPELANFQTQISTYKQDALQSGANALTDRVVNEFARTLDLNKAMSDIGALRNLGVNVDDAFTKILQSGAATKSTQVSNILSAAQNAMANDPSLTPSAAVAQAVAAGAGTVVSPVESAAKTETQIATDVTKTAAAGAGVNDPRTTVAPVQPANTPQSSGNLNATSIAALPNLTPGMRSEEVKTLQNYLIQQGFAIPDGATGLYGPQTQAAVAAFQQKNSIDTAGSPGYFGPRTKAFLSGSQSTVAPAPTAPVVVAPTPAPTVAPAAPAPIAQPAAPAPTAGAMLRNVAVKGSNGQTTYYSGDAAGLDAYKRSVGAK